MFRKGQRDIFFPFIQCYTEPRPCSIIFHQTETETEYTASQTQSPHLRCSAHVHLAGKVLDVRPTLTIVSTMSARMGDSAGKQQKHQMKNYKFCSRDRTAGYSCSCVSGWRGQYCQEPPLPPPSPRTPFADHCSLCQVRALICFWVNQ